MQTKLTSTIAVLAVSFSVLTVSPQVAFSQNDVPGNVSVVSLQTIPGQNGQQMVVTPKGKVVPLPGPGVNGNFVNVYLGSQGGAWYVDKNGQQVDLTAAIYAYQSSAQTTQVPQYAPQPVTNNYYESSSGGSGGSSAAGTAAAAGLGAAAGAAITNSLMQPTYPYYHGVPYGTPLYYGSGGQPYYQNRQGSNVYVGNNDVNVNRNATVNNTANTTNTAAYSNANVNQVHANSLDQQQKWYNQQVSSKSGNYKNWQGQQQQDNPFVHQDAQNPWSDRRANQDGAGRRASRGDAANGADGGGRFGSRGGEQTGDGGGRFGSRGGDQAGDGGGRFGKRGGDQAGDGGGRFGNRGGDGGGRSGNRGGEGFGGRRR